jgi:type III secretion system YscQ/HrcQ family protein
MNAVTRAALPGHEPCWRPARELAPQLAGGLLDSLNAIAAPRRGVALMVRQHALAITFHALPREPAGISVDVRIGQHPARLVLPTALITALLGTAGRADAGTDVLELLALALLQDAQDAWSAALGVPLQWATGSNGSGRVAGPAVAPCAWLGMEITLPRVAAPPPVSAGNPPAVTYHAALAMDEACCRAVAELLRCLPCKPPCGLDDLRLPLAIVAGWQYLQAGQAAALKPGDAVLLETENDGWTAMLRGRRLAVVEAAPGGLRYRRGLTPDDLEGVAMTTTATQAAAAANTLDLLPVQLTCEVARLEVSLQELRSYAPGHLIALAALPGQEIELRVNGQRLGRGELVRLGESLAVRIIEWPPHE